jgi:hypothetical protein
VDKVDGMTGIRHCEACGQVKFPSDHWQRKLAEQKEQFRVLEDELLVLGDERSAAVKDAERYRWLRSEDAVCLFAATIDDGPINGEFLDDKIDAAMKEMK